MYLVNILQHHFCDIVDMGSVLWNLLIYIYKRVTSIYIFIKALQWGDLKLNLTVDVDEMKVQDVQFEIKFVSLNIEEGEHLLPTGNHGVRWFGFDQSCNGFLDHFETGLPSHPFVGPQCVVSSLSQNEN